MYLEYLLPKISMDICGMADNTQSIPHFQEHTKVYKLLTFAHVVIKIALAHKTKLDARFGLPWFGFVSFWPSPFCLVLLPSADARWACFLVGPIRGPSYISICIFVLLFVFVLPDSPMLRHFPDLYFARSPI